MLISAPGAGDPPRGREYERTAKITANRYPQICRYSVIIHCTAYGRQCTVCFVQGPVVYSFKTHFTLDLLLYTFYDLKFECVPVEINRRTQMGMERISIKLNHVGDRENDFLNTLGQPLRKPPGAPDGHRDPRETPHERPQGDRGYAFFFCGAAGRKPLDKYRIRKTRYYILNIEYRISSF